MKITAAVAVMREDYYSSYMPFDISKGDEFYLHTTDSIYRSEQEYFLMKRTFAGIQIFGCPKNIVDVEHRCMTSKFNIGDIVVDARLKEPIPFRIYTTEWSKVDFFNSDGWGVSQNLCSGKYDGDLRLASHEEVRINKAYITYYDQLMDKKTKVFRTLPGC